MAGNLQDTTPLATPGRTPAPAPKALNADPCGVAASSNATHVRQLGGESPLHNRMEVKC
jgi:hypothetical protein